MSGSLTFSPCLKNKTPYSQMCIWDNLYNECQVVIETAYIVNSRAISRPCCSDGHAVTSLKTPLMAHGWDLSLHLDWTNCEW
jgi:hypothetical protein